MYEKQDQLCVAYKKPTLNTKTCRREVRVCRKIHPANTHQKEARIAILISDRANFIARTIIRDKEGHYITINRSSLQDLTILNVYLPKYLR